MIDKVRRWRANVLLSAVLVLALALRMAVAVRLPSVIHPDETLQYLEQAYRVGTGRGLVPWEYVAGIRSWIIPGTLVPVIAAARLVSPSPEVTLLAIAFTASVLSLAVVACAYVLGRRVGGEAAGLTAALLVALWPEIVLMSSHVLADTAAAVPLMAALAVGYRPGEQPSGGTTRTVVTGFLLCLAAVLRPQLVPAIAVAGIWIAGLDLRRYLALIAGAVPVLVIFSLVDWLTWGAPFLSIIRYVAVNQGGVATSFGTLPFYYYVGVEGHNWLFGLPVIGLAALAGMRRLPLLGVVSLLILLVFSGIAHKEYRFLYPALPLLFTLCGVGTVEIARWWTQRRRGQRLATAAITLALIWTGTVAIAATSRHFLDTMQSGHNALAAINAINADPDVCGVAVYPTIKWPDAGAVRFRDDIPLYKVGARDGGARAYNAILAIEQGRPTDAAFPGFRAVMCAMGSPAPEACFLKSKIACVPGQDERLEAEPTPAVKVLLRKMGL